MRILHIAFTDEWDQGRAADGGYQVSSRDRTLSDEGFIHASSAAQVAGVLARFYADADPAALSLLVLDVPALVDAGSAVRWDEVAGSATPFPHIYGPIGPDAVVAVLPITGTAGAPVLPDLSGWDVAPLPPR